MWSSLNTCQLRFQKLALEQSVEESRSELLAVRTDHADTVSSLEAQVNLQHSFCLLAESCQNSL